MTPPIPPPAAPTSGYYAPYQPAGAATAQGYSAPGYYYPGTAAAPAYSGSYYPGSAAYAPYNPAGAAAANAAFAHGVSAAPGTHLTDFDPQSAPIPPLYRGFMAVLPLGTNLGLQILADVASLWFNRQSTDPNDLLNRAFDIFRQRTGSPVPAGSITDTKLRQIVNRVIREFQQGGGSSGQNPGGGGSGQNPPVTTAGAGGVLTVTVGTQSFTLTAPPGAQITVTGLQSDGQGGSSPSRDRVAPPIPPPAAPSAQSGRASTATGQNGHTPAAPAPRGPTGEEAPPPPNPSPTTPPTAPSPPTQETAPTPPPVTGEPP